MLVWLRVPGFWSAGPGFWSAGRGLVTVADRGSPMYPADRGSPMYLRGWRWHAEHGDQPKVSTSSQAEVKFGGQWSKIDHLPCRVVGSYPHR